MIADEEIGVFSPAKRCSYVPLAVAGAIVLVLGVVGIVGTTSDPALEVTFPTTAGQTVEASVVVASVAGLDAELETTRTEGADSSAAGACPLAERMSARLRVLDARGAPIVAARLAYRDESGLVIAGTTDAHGVADLIARAGQIVFVRAPQRALARAVCEIDADGLPCVVLDDAGSIAGRVEIDGQIAREPVELSFNLAEPLGVPAGFTPALDDALGQPAQELDRLTLWSALDGTFAFAGLPGHTRGSLRRADWMRFEQDDEVAIRVDAEPADVLVRLTRLPSACVRIVDRDGIPLAGFTLWFEFEWAGGYSHVTACATDAMGRAEVGMDDFATEPAGTNRLAITGFDERIGSVHFERTGPWDQRTDLGDVTIEALRVVMLDVRDESDAPIAGVQLFVDCETALGTPTDAGGKTTIHVPNDLEQLLAAAAGFEIERVELDPSAERCDVTLRRDGLVRVVVRAADGSAAPGMSVEIEGASAAFEGPSVGVSTLPGMPTEFTSAIVERCEFVDTTRLTAATNEHGEVVMRRLPVGVALKCTVRESPSVEGITSMLVLERGAERVLEVGVRDPGWTLRLRIANDAGDALPGADVDVYDGENCVASAVSDAAGECAVTSFRNDVLVCAGRRHLGFESLTASRSIDTGVTRTLVLHPERTVDVVVTSARGSPIDCLCVTVFPVVGDRAQDSRLVSTGWLEHGHRVHGLGARAASIVIDVGGWKTERFVDSTTSLVRVVLADSGSVIMPPARLGDAPWDSDYVFVDRDGRTTQRFPAWSFPENETFAIAGVCSGEYEVRLVQSGDPEIIVASARDVKVTADAAVPVNLTQSAPTR